MVAYVAGRSAPIGKRMGHAGAIVMGNAGTAETKIERFEDAGVKVAEKPSDVARLAGSSFGYANNRVCSLRFEAKSISERFASEC